MHAYPKHPTVNAVVLDLIMATTTDIVSFSMPRQLRRKLDETLPMYGDRSKLMTFLVEQFLLGRLDVTEARLKSRRHNVALSNTKWQEP